VYLLLIVVILVLNIFFIDQKVRYNMLGKELTDLNNELSIVKDRNLKLELEIAGLTSLPRIERIAREEHNMILSDLSNTIVMKWDTNTIDKDHEPVIKRTWYTIKTHANEMILPDNEFVERF